MLTVETYKFDNKYHIFVSFWWVALFFYTIWLRGDCRAAVRYALNGSIKL